MRSPGEVEVDLWGYVMFCPGLALGRLGLQSLAEMVGQYDCEGHPLAGVLAREKGPQGLAARAAAWGYRAPEGISSRCHLCYDVRRFLRPRFADLLGPPNCYGVEEGLTGLRNP